MSDLFGDLENKDQAFLDFYALYPRKKGVSRPQAYRAWIRARYTWKVPVSAIMDGLRRFPFDPNPQYQPHPSTWLNQRRWEIEDDTPPPSVSSQSKGAWMEGYEIPGHYIDVEIDPNGA